MSKSLSMNHSRPLGELATFLNGGTPSREVARYFEGSTPWITSADLKEESDFVTQARFYITQEAIESSATRVVPKGNLLFVSRTGVGKVAIAGMDVCISQDFTGIVPDTNLVDVRYLFRFLQSKQAYFVKHQRGATIKGVTRRVIEELEVPLPPLPEQRRIAAILDAADALRAKRRAALGKLDALLQAVFLEMFGDPVGNERGWERRAIQDVATVKGGLQLTSRRSVLPVEVPYLRVANVYRGYLDLSEIKTMRVTEAELERALLEDGDLLLVEGHGNPEEIGRCAVWDGSIRPCVHQNHLIRVQADRQRALPVYLAFYLNSRGGRRQLISAGKTTSGLNTINTNRVRETQVLVPPLELQCRFESISRAIGRLSLAQQELARRQEALFQSLQKQAFRGEL